MERIVLMVNKTQFSDYWNCKISGIDALYGNAYNEALGMGVCFEKKLKEPLACLHCGAEFEMVLKLKEHLAAHFEEKGRESAAHKDLGLDEASSAGQVA